MGVLERVSEPADYPGELEQALDLWRSIDVLAIVEEEALGATVTEERERAVDKMEELRIRLVALGLPIAEA